MLRKKPACLLISSLLALALAAPPSPAQQNPHADPLNYDPLVRDAYTHFYNLDYDGAIARFDQVIAAHPNDPMAYAYDLMVTIFRELYSQDLLDTTYYAHDSFLTTGRKVEIPAAYRERIEFLATRPSTSPTNTSRTIRGTPTLTLPAATHADFTQPSSPSPITPSSAPPGKASPPATIPKPPSRSIPITPTPTWLSVSSSSPSPAFRGWSAWSLALPESAATRKKASIC